MQGYIDNILELLNKEERRRYRSYYCRLCNALSLRYGYGYRLLVNYDAVIYMIITKVAINDEFYCYKHTCQALCLDCEKNFSDDELGQFFASVIACGAAVAVNDKLYDNSQSKHDFFRFAFSKIFSPTDAKDTRMFEKTAARFNNLNALEKEKHSDINLYLDYYADSVLLCIENKYSDLGESHKELIRQIAKWIDYMDMLEDYEEDYKSGDFNPLCKENISTLNEYIDKYWSDVYSVMSEIHSKMKKTMNDINFERYPLELGIISKTVMHLIPSTTKRIITTAKKKSILPLD